MVLLYPASACQLNLNVTKPRPFTHLAAKLFDISSTLVRRNAQNAPERAPIHCNLDKGENNLQIITTDVQINFTFEDDVENTIHPQSDER